jgi:hypothetical protein
LGDLVRIDYNEQEGKLVFLKEESAALLHKWENPDEAAMFEEIFSKNASAIKESKFEGKIAKPSIARERRG